MERLPSVELKSLLVTKVRKANTASGNFKLNNLIKGFEGEREFDRWIDTYKENDWIHLKDIRISASVPTQIDSMLITPNGIHVYDNKNHDTKCTYFNKVLTVDGKEVNHNIFTQADISLERIKAVLKAIGYEAPINFYVVFINQHCQFSCDEDFRKRCLLRNELREHFRLLKKQSSLISNLNQLKAKILHYQVTDPYNKIFIRPE